MASIQELCEAATEDGPTKPLVKKFAKFGGSSSSKKKNVSRDFRRWFKRYDF